MVAVGRTVQPIDCRGRHTESGVEPEAGIGHRHVIVDGFGQRDDRQALLRETNRVLLGAIAPDADYGVETVLRAVRENLIPHVPNAALDLTAVRLDATRAENGTTDTEYAVEGMTVQRKRAVLDQPEKTVADPHGLDSATEQRLPHTPDCGVQTGTVASGSQDTDPLDLLHAPAIAGCVRRVGFSGERVRNTLRRPPAAKIAARHAAIKLEQRCLTQRPHWIQPRRAPRRQ